MTDWMTIRVKLVAHGGEELLHPPGRVLLVHADHTFADLAEAIDTSLGRWDLSPLHAFDVEGRQLLLGGGDDDGLEVEDSDEVTVGEVGLRLGAPFTYTFDLGEEWLHECVVDAEGVDPFEAYGEEPEAPVPLFGWGTLPDQYSRIAEDDQDDDLIDLEAPAWDLDREDAADEAVEVVDAEPAQASWTAVERALDDVPRERDEAALRHAVAELRRADTDAFPTSTLWAAAGLETPPEDDEALWLALAAGVIEPDVVAGVDADEEAGWTALEPADWAAAIIELVRAGAGQAADPDNLLALIERCPEVESEELGPEDEQLLLDGLAVVSELWRALGVLDDADRLTSLGRWGLPESLRLAWSERVR